MTGWRWTQAHANPSPLRSPVKFPVNREKYRELDLLAVPSRPRGFDGRPCKTAAARSYPRSGAPVNALT